MFSFVENIHVGEAAAEIRRAMSWEHLNWKQILVTLLSLFLSKEVLEVHIWVINDLTAAKTPLSN